MLEGADTLTRGERIEVVGSWLFDYMVELPRLSGQEYTGLSDRIAVVARAGMRRCGAGIQLPSAPKPRARMVARHRRWGTGGVQAGR
jgi:hypothetical protein